MAGKIYDADEIMKMAVGLITPDIENADYNGDGRVTSSDARTNNRIASGLSIDTPVAGNTGVASTTNGNKNIYAASSAYQNQADAVYKGIQDKMQNAGKSNADIFAVSDAYQKQADELYEKIKNTPDFKYDFNEDEVFKALREQYMKDGRLAAENVAGQAAALSGGYANSYGTTAAGQAYMGAIDELYDVLPELEDRAYSRYQDKRNAQLQNWEVLQNRAATERGYAESERAYNDDRDAYLMELALQNYDILQNKADNERAYAESERAYEDSRDAYLMELALEKAQLGDYSGLKELGVDTSNAEYEAELNKALTLAQMGDYSALQALGIDVSSIQKQNELDFALAAAELGDYSFLKSLGIDVSAMEAPSVSYNTASSTYINDDDYSEENEIEPNPYTGDIPKLTTDMVTTRMAGLLDILESASASEAEKARAEKQLLKYYEKSGG